MGNSSGSYPSTRENTMRAYDKLPASARKALQDAVFDWATQPFYSKWRDQRKGYKTGVEIAARIKDADAKELSKKKHQR